ncbi:MAG: rRNA maturation RNase YbeY [Candidatus Coproplasma sp.]
MLHVVCEDKDFSALEVAFEGEYSSDCELSIEVVIVDKTTIKDLNSRFRSIDKVTDVLSFPTLDNIRGKKLILADYPLDTDGEGTLFLGSIAICEEVAKEQAEEYGHSEEREFYYLATHGVCHLLGYDHMTEEDKQEMRAKEERVMSKLGLERV